MRDCRTFRVFEDIAAGRPQQPRPDDQAMTPRGPDGDGTWISGENGVGLGHRRLSIIDLSEGGAQPMVLDGNRLSITYNGEIYNFRALREELECEGAKFVSGSDTEVLLHLYDRHGTSMVEKLRGMFSFAIFDRNKRGLFLGPRRVWNQTALLHRRWRHIPVRFSGKSSVSGRRYRYRAVGHRAGRLLRMGIRARTLDDVRKHPRPTRRLHPADRRQRRADTEALFRRDGYTTRLLPTARQTGPKQNCAPPCSIR